MTFAESLTACGRKTRDITGRASRSELWWYYLFYFIVQLAIALFGVVVNNEDLANLIAFGVGCGFLLSLISVGARRLHDTGRSGWWQLLELTLIGVIPVIYWWSQPGTPETNRFGPPPVS